MTFEEFEILVREELARIADPEETGEWNDAAREMLAEIDRPLASDLPGTWAHGPPYIAHPWHEGYSVRDAVRSILLCSDNLMTEDRCMAEQEKLRVKYTDARKRE